MNLLESRLREALRREEPPVGFAERVLTRAAEKEHKTQTGTVAWRGMRWGLAGALCLTLVIGSIAYRREQAERARSEAAKEQLMLALRIAGDQLQLVRSIVIQP